MYPDPNEAGMPSQESEADASRAFDRKDTTGIASGDSSPTGHGHFFFLLSSLSSSRLDNLTPSQEHTLFARGPYMTFPRLPCSSTV